MIRQRLAGLVDERGATHLFDRVVNQALDSFAALACAVQGWPFGRDDREAAARSRSRRSTAG